MLMKHLDKESVVAIGTATILGGALRFAPAKLAGFPINDGGMFLAMINDLQANQFILPSVTLYNFSDIPFAYPPFGFYLAAFLSSWLSIPPIDLLLWLPPLVSTAIIPAFYWSSFTLTASRPRASVATMLYAFVPGVYDWLIMGGGLTRSLGILYLVLSIGFVYQLFRVGGIANLGFSIGFCSLTVLSHPEAGLQIAALSLVLWLLCGRSLAGLKSALALSVGVGLITSIWWLTILRFHGTLPFISAMQTGARETLLASLFHTFFSTQGGLPLLPFLGLIGLFVAIRSRAIFPILWLFTPFVVDPRNAPAVSIFPLLVLAADGLVFLNNEYTRLFTLSHPSTYTRVLRNVPVVLFAALLLYLSLVSMRANDKLVSVSLTSDDRETMEWVSKNTPGKGQFLLITNTGQLSTTADPYQEWFPVLAQRKSLNTIQGLEWTEGARFFQYSRELVALQACKNVACLNQWLVSEGVQADYYLIVKNRSVPELLDSFRHEQSYTVIFESSNAIIFEATP